MGQWFHPMWPESEEELGEEPGAETLTFDQELKHQTALVSQSFIYSQTRSEAGSVSGEDMMMLLEAPDMFGQE